MSPKELLYYIDVYIIFCNITHSWNSLFEVSQQMFSAGNLLPMIQMVSKSYALIDSNEKANPFIQQAALVSIANQDPDCYSYALWMLLGSLAFYSRSRNFFNPLSLHFKI